MRFVTSRPDPRSGLDSGGKWTPAFPGQRPPFQPGHELGGRPPEHGAYAELALSPRTEALATRLRELMDGHVSDADEPARRVASLAAIQLSCATGVVEEVTAAIERGEDLDVWLSRLESRARLSQDAKGWSNTVRQWFDSLGLTPTGRAVLEAAQQPQGIPMHEAKDFALAVFRLAFEFVDRSRHAEFNARIDSVVGPIVGALPPAESEPAEDADTS